MSRFARISDDRNMLTSTSDKILRVLFYVAELALLSVVSYGFIIVLYVLVGGFDGKV